MQLCFASNNINKLKEIRPLVEPDFRILSLTEIGCLEELPETQPTIEGNAIQKAEYVYHHYKIACFADDTGLEVQALNNEPGVYSARYAGEHKSSEDNIDLLLARLSTKEDKSALFKTVIALAGFGPIKTFEGIVNGQIIDHRRGSMGFGYDPVFIPSGFTKTFAEMAIHEKNPISHRGKAIQKLVEYLQTVR